MSELKNSGAPSSNNKALRIVLTNLKNHIAQRTHAAFLLRTDGSEDAALIIAEALKQREDSSLMRHELAYILGQMQHKVVCPLLCSILMDENDDTIVRHECAEALGAIGCTSSLDVLKEFRNHKAPEISETCQIATDLITWKQNSNNKIECSSFLSIDPAPPDECSTCVEVLRDTLLDKSAALFMRYRAMFALRNLNSDASALAIASGLQDSSALFRHEAAYVLGQLEKPVTVSALCASLQNSSEHAMVRHEAAEALGAIGNPTALKILKEFCNDPEQIVRESCEVALNIADHWSTPTQS